MGGGGGGGGNTASIDMVIHCALKNTSILNYIDHAVALCRLPCIKHVPSHYCRNPQCYPNRIHSPILWGYNSSYPKDIYKYNRVQALQE